MLLAGGCSNFPIILSIGDSDGGIEFFLRLCILFLISKGLCTQQSREKDVSNTSITRNQREELSCPENTIVLLTEIEILYWRRSTSWHGIRRIVPLLSE